MKVRSKVVVSAISIALSVVLLAVAVMVGMFYNSSQSVDLNPRIMELSENSIDSQGAFEEFEGVSREKKDSLYTYRAQKKFVKESFLPYDKISDSKLTEDEIETVDYEVVINETSGDIAVNAVFANNGEQIVDTLHGNVFYDEDNETDVIFNVDGELYSAREILGQSSIEECNFWGDLLHAIANAALKLLALVEPAIKLTLASASDVAALLLVVGQKKYLANYNANSKKPQPSGFVTDQSSYYDWAFGNYYLDEKGCEVIAGYNLARAKGIKINLAQTTYLFESLGIEIGFAAGYLGSNPYQIGYYLKALNLNYIKVTSYSSLQSYIKNSTQYHMIVSRWNNTSTKSPIHTFYVNKTDSNSMRTYNMKLIQDFSPAYSANELFNESPKKTFIVAYLIKK